MAFSVAAVLVASSLVQAGEHDVGRIELPPGPAARAFAGVGPETEPARFDVTGLPASSEDARFDREETWRAWARDVRAAAEEGEKPETAAALERRARLCVMAAVQGRTEDAWAHFAALGADPSWCAAVLPLLLPGVPLEVHARVGTARGGLPGALPDGVELHPCLPPPPTAERRIGGYYERRLAALSGLRIGDATVSMRISLEVEGVQIDVQHEGGGPAHLSVLLPEPDDREVFVAYVDWMRQEQHGLRLPVEVAPGKEPTALWGRFQPRGLPWPTQLPEKAPAELERAGMTLLVKPDDLEHARITALAAGLAELLGFNVRVAAPDDAQAAGIRVDLSQQALRGRKLAQLVSLAERFALAR